MRISRHGGGAGDPGFRSWGLRGGGEGKVHLCLSVWGRGFGATAGVGRRGKVVLEEGDGEEGSVESAGEQRRRRLWNWDSTDV